MQRFEYCEVSWSEGETPQITFFKPTGSETVALRQDESRGDASDWDALKFAMVQLGLSGWELISTSLEGTGLFFKRQLH
jgi:hypothetical protein